MTVPAELDTFRQVVARVASAHRVKTYQALAPLGFELLDVPHNFDYHCTPVNSATFAATGGWERRHGLRQEDDPDEGR